MRIAANSLFFAWQICEAKPNFIQMIIDRRMTQKFQNARPDYGGI